MSTSIEKKIRAAELARLYYLFDHLASRGHSRPPQQSDKPGSPAAPPSLGHLHSLLRAHNHHLPATRKEAPAMRHDADSKTAQFDRDLATAFPLGEGYQFTFKLMLHKLYELDEWVDKVKEVLEASQRRFKSIVADRYSPDAATPEPTSARGNLKKGEHIARPRSHSVLDVSKTRDPLSPGLRSPPSTPHEGDHKTLKKRCVGRRKSFGGIPAEGSTNATGSRWIYDAAVSSVDTDMGARDDTSLSHPTRAYCVRPRYKSLTQLERVDACLASSQRVTFAKRPIARLSSHILRDSGLQNRKKSSDTVDSNSTCADSSTHTQANQATRPTKKRPLYT